MPIGDTAMKERLLFSAPSQSVMFSSLHTQEEEAMNSPCWWARRSGVQGSFSREVTIELTLEDLLLYSELLEQGWAWSRLNKYL